MYDNNSSNRSLYSPDSATDLMVYENGEFSPFGGYPASLFPLSIDEKNPMIIYIILILFKMPNMIKIGFI